MTWLRAHAIPIALFVAGLVGYGVVAGDRLKGPSSNPHFALQADAWLRGRIAIDKPVGDDWARVETVVLDDGSVVRGRRMQTRPTFRIAGGGEIPKTRITRTVSKTAYMSFPALPAVLMVPQALVAGRRANDVAFTVVFAAACLPLLFFTLRRLYAAGLSRRSRGEDVWLVVALAFGSVFFFSAVQGKVWYTAHVVGVFFAIAYAWASIEARSPILAGLALGCATLTRTPMAFMFPFFVLEAVRMAGGLPHWRGALRRLAFFAAPILVIAIVAAAYNHHRFDEATEFGHSYLQVRQQAQIEADGLFSYDYLSRNLAVAFTLLPELGGDPAIRISGHGLAIWFTTPLLFFLVWPRERSSTTFALWLTVALVAVPTFFYQNSGWIQFGYRFSLDYLPFLILLVALGGRALGWFARGLIVFGIVVNLFGALTFDRHWKYYDPSYDVVIRH